MRQILLLASFLIVGSIFSQDLDKNNTVKQIIKNKGQVEVQFFEKNPEQLKRLSSQISIDDYKNGLVTAFLSKKQVDDFLEHNYNYRIVTSRNVMDLTMATSVSEMSNWDKYPTYEVFNQMMINYATDYPNICRLDTIGFSQEGRVILVLKITDNPDISEFEPEFFYTGQMHGDELVSSILFLRLIDYLLTGYGNNAEITNLVDNIEIWINPLSNPDGCYHGGNHTVSGATRYVANGIDLNRNYPSPHPSYGEHPDGEEYAQETIDMMNFCQSHDFVMSANAHSGAEVVNYPWDAWNSNEKSTADNAWWQMVSKEYADTCQTNSPSNYLTDVSNTGYTNGGDWYYAFGSRQDWMNYFNNCREMTLEWSSDKFLDAEHLPDHWNYNRDAIINYLKQVQYGINGLVTDACIGQPIRAKIEIQSHDIDNSHVYSSSDVGNFHRPIMAGTYNIVVSAEGYDNQVFNNISVSNYATTALNATLNPLEPVADFTFESTDNCLANYNLNNTTVGNATYTWTFPDNSQSTEEHTSISFANNGTYTISLSAENCAGTHTVSHDIVVDNLVSTPNTSDIERCGEGEVSFSATANGAGAIEWFDAEQGNLIGTGNTYTTTINNDLTVWVQQVEETTSIFGAKEDNSGSGSYYSSSTVHGLIFDCYEAVTLKSVKVYADGTSNRTITLKDEDGNIIYQEDKNIPDGESRVTLNWDLPVANNLYLEGSSEPNLYRNGSFFSADLAYPFAVSSYISITGNTADDYGYYYYFYDWEVEQAACSSAMIPVTASVLPLGVSDFTFNTNGFDVQFTDHSTAANTYAWDFGDGTTSTEANPTHQYSQDGTYTVSLTITNDCGNFSSSSEVVINTVGISQVNSSISVYPNPAQNEILINTKPNTPIELIDISGKTVLNTRLNQSKTINIEHLKPGIYTLKIKGEHTTKLIKVIKE